MTDPKLPRVLGRQLPGSINAFELRCLSCLYAEQQKPEPDAALISVLEDAVRFTREHLDQVEKYLSKPLAVDVTDLFNS